jgi:hypothetical protein
MPRKKGRGRTTPNQAAKGDDAVVIPKSGRISPPTGDRRHFSTIREGKISGETFCKDNDRRKELGLDEIREREF